MPIEAEWEYAARGGLEGQPSPWGAAREPAGEHRMSVWQGRFSGVNTEEDRYYAARSANTPDSSTANLGFRCAAGA